MAFLPAYAPELNPTEYIWGHLKEHEIANLCPKNFSHLSLEAIRALKRMRRNHQLPRRLLKFAQLMVQGGLSETRPPAAAATETAFVIAT